MGIKRMIISAGVTGSHENMRHKIVFNRINSKMLI